MCVRCTILHYAKPFHSTLHHLCVRCTIRHYAEPFHAALHHLCVRCTILHYAELFHATLHRLCVRCATRRYPDPFDATQHRLCAVLQRSAKLFAIELVHLTISCSNSTWATGPFIIWLNYPCLGCSASRRKTKPSIIWPCHSFISYSILQLIFRPALYLLIYLTSLYFWWWRPPIHLVYLRPFSAAGHLATAKLKKGYRINWLKNNKKKSKLLQIKKFNSKILKVQYIYN